MAFPFSVRVVRTRRSARKGFRPPRSALQPWGTVASGLPLNQGSAPRFPCFSDARITRSEAGAFELSSFLAFQLSSVPRHSGGRYRRMVSEFVTTDTLENAMAAPAITGLRSHPVKG
ncbi:hypothetical protein JCM30394_16650 [Deferrisoma palaeochoriense]